MERGKRRGDPVKIGVDVGGTNTRMALSRDGKILAGTVRNYVNDAWDNFFLMVTAFLDDQNSQPDEMVIAVAGPVRNGQARLTNRSWLIEASRIKAEFSCKNIHLLNDLNLIS